MRKRVSEKAGANRHCQRCKRAHRAHTRRHPQLPTVPWVVYLQQHVPCPGARPRQKGLNKTQVIISRREYPTTARRTRFPAPPSFPRPRGAGVDGTKAGDRGLRVCVQAQWTASRIVLVVLVPCLTPLLSLRLRLLDLGRCVCVCVCACVSTKGGQPTLMV